MIEIYLFISPLGRQCLKTEKMMLDLISNENKKFQFRIIPLLNLHTVQRYLIKQSLPTNDIKLRNKIFREFYSASLDYKALLLQGKRKGQSFLFKLQEKVGVQKIPYSAELVKEIIQEVGADQEMFQVDRKSSAVKRYFENDQKTAHEMGITEHPSVVVFNYACDRDYGILIEDCGKTEIFHELFKTDEDSCQLNFNPINDDKRNRLTNANLHLIRK